MIVDYLKENGYSSFEVCFQVRVKRKGIFNIMEILGFIKPKTDYYAVMIRDIDSSEVLMGNMTSYTEIKDIKTNGLR